MLYRVIIKRESKNFLYGKAYNGKRYKIQKNEFSKKLKVGSDIYFYAKKEERLLGTVLIPISDKEAGVKDIHSQALIVEK